MNYAKNRSCLIVIVLLCIQTLWSMDNSQHCTTDYDKWGTTYLTYDNLSSLTNYPEPEQKKIVKHFAHTCYLDLLGQYLSQNKQTKQQVTQKYKRNECIARTRCQQYSAVLAKDEKVSVFCNQVTIASLSPGSRPISLEFSSHDSFLRVRTSTEIISYPMPRYFACLSLQQLADLYKPPLEERAQKTFDDVTTFLSGIFLSSK
ncbi:MAG: hypothetical protein H6679_01500 [Epsilonproteobacteria bacterium]|nr:hypothetical protein [Campylobacterota bacterium]